MISPRFATPTDVPVCEAHVQARLETYPGVMPPWWPCCEASPGKEGGRPEEIAHGWDNIATLTGEGND
ncbi:MAG: hypothetical protein ACREF3_07700 [Acetobacteraceae bacterium]